jgi:hypothetical protein
MYLLITKLLKILIFAHGEHKKKNNKNVFNFILYSHSQLVTGARDPDLVVSSFLFTRLLLSAILYDKIVFFLFSCAFSI